MPLQQDFTILSMENGLLTIGLTPPLNITGWSLQLQMFPRANGVSPLVTKSMAPGFLGVSGMNQVNLNQGIFSASFNPGEVSGLQSLRGTYYFGIQRTDSGFVTMLAEGYRLLPE